MLELVGDFDADITHPDLGFISRGTRSYEFYWTDRWFNIFRFHEPDGSFRNFYCNIAMPPSLADGVLDYVDLDIDVLVWPGLRYSVLDMDEFRSNAELFRYPVDVIQSAEKSLEELTGMIEGNRFPFDEA